MMMTNNTVNILLLAVTLVTLGPAHGLQGKDIQDNIAALRAVDLRAKGHAEAIVAWRELSQLPASQLTTVLAGMDGASDLSVNWFRAAADTIAQRLVREGKPLPVKALEEFIADTSHHPRARRTAYELISQVDPKAHERIIPGLLNDPSLELRRDAVAYAIAQSAKLSDSRSAIASYQIALNSARDLDQIEAVTKSIRDLGGKVELPRQFGFLVNWHLVGPFDNVGKAGFNRVYAPEEKVNLASTYTAKEGEVKWFSHTTEDDYGTVDLNKAVGKHMGAICYAHTVFVSAEKRQVDIRLGCINGNKIWLNGELIASNHVYHAATAIDQYIAKCTLRKGPNELLIKVAQNEQTEDWAQNWQFQLRVCDKYGTAVLSTDR
jgi:hypothetical protein